MNNDSYTPIALLGIMLPIIISLGAFLMIFGLRFLRNRENMAMIERGISPQSQMQNSFNILRISLLFVGIGIGLLFAYLIDSSGMIKGDSDPLYFAMIFVFGGAGLLISFLFEKRAEIKTIKSIDAI